jgi:leader peptidase (prepilin peptidase)/N-methyltransferase
VAIAAATALGLIVGSFLNVVILRLPPMLEYRWRLEASEVLGSSDSNSTAPPGLIADRSRCPQCQAQIRAFDNIPVLSYVLLRGRCRACGLRISPQYPLVELATGIATALCVWRFGIGAEGIDARTQLLPDSLTLPLLWAGLLLSLMPLFVDARQAIVGAAAGYLSLWSVYWLFKLLTGKEGMGYGDFKLLGALGAWFGAGAILPIILMSSVVGAVVGGAIMVLRGQDSQVPMPWSSRRSYAAGCRSWRCSWMPGVPVIGLTGGIASGKSTVSDAFAALGAAIVDTDLISRELVLPGRPALAEIRETFGEAVINAEGGLDRRQLRTRVFADSQAKVRLEAILHPRIRDAALAAVAQARSSAPYVVLVVPLLVESGAYAWVDRVLVVDTTPEIQQRLLVARDQVDLALAQSMIQAQASREQRLAMADDVVRNSAGIAGLLAQVRMADRRYRALAAS